MALALGLSAVVALSACNSNDNTTKTSSSTTPASAGSSTGAAAPAASAAACGSGGIKGAGSTFQKPVEDQWIADFGDVCKGAQVDYQGGGSGAGKAQFGEGTIDFAGSDSTLTADEAAKAKTRCKDNAAIHIPVTAGAAVITYNLKGVDKLQLSAATVAGIYTGQITKWDDAKIKADNPGATLPPTGIQAFHRSEKSGTTKIFTSYLDKNSAGAWTLGAQEELAWPGGQGAKGSDGVTAGVKQTDGGIGYVEANFAQVNKLPVAAIKGAGADFVQASGDSISKALASATVAGDGNDVMVKVDYGTTAAGAYPLSAVTYVIVCSKSNANPALLKAYLGYVTTTGQQVTGGLGYAPLPDTLAAKVKAAIDSIA
jgi:phosphate transport system substrate-binding protein